MPTVNESLLSKNMVLSFLKISLTTLIFPKTPDELGVVENDTGLVKFPIVVVIRVVIGELLVKVVPELVTVAVVSRDDVVFKKSGNSVNEFQNDFFCSG